MKWTKDKLALFFSMKEEGCSIEEICNALGCERKAVYDKTKSLIKMNGGRMPKYKGKVKSNDKNNDKGDKAMSKYPEQKQKIDPVEFWAMLDAGKSVKEVADYFGCCVQSVYNRITKGRPKGLEPKAVRSDVQYDDEKGFSAVPETSAEISVGDDVQGGKGVEANTVGAIHESPETNNVDNTVGAIHESPETNNIDNVEGDTDMNTKEAIMNTFLGSGRPSGDECAEKPDIIDLAFKAKYMAFYAGFTPNHMMLDMQKERSEIIVSGEGEDGKVYEIEFSVSDPMYFSR